MVTARRHALTDAEAWAIVCAPDTDAETLGRRLGVSANTIRNARARYRRRGWSCRVAYAPCRWCGDFLVQRGHRAGRAAYHDACRPMSRRAIQRDLDHQRWERLPDHRRDALLARAHDHGAEQQAATLEHAGNAGARWDADDDTYLVAHWYEPAHVTARALQRSLYAVWARKVHHGRRGTAPQQSTSLEQLATRVAKGL